jgi:hypothetical protein
MTFLFIIPVVNSIMRYLRIQFGGGQYGPNLINRWLPVAEAVQAGTPLYLGVAADNKPPGFMILNQLLSRYEFYKLALLILTGLSIGISAVLIVKILSTRFEFSTGVIASGLFILTLPLIEGYIINPRQFALVGILWAVWKRSPVKKGIGVAIAGLMTQYAILFVFVLIWDLIIRQESKYMLLPSLILYILSGLAVVALAFGIVTVQWGWDAALAGFYWSFGINLGVVSPGIATSVSGYSMWSIERPVVWGGMLLFRLGWLAPMLGLAAVALWKVIITDQFNQAKILVLSCVVLMIPLLVRPYTEYWILPLPFLCSLGGLGLLTLPVSYDWIPK